MLERPLLYIVSPTYVVENSHFEESTSVYERDVPEKISNELIARQLHYFARNKPRRVILLLVTGERVLGEVMSVQGAEVKVACFEQIRLIHADTIAAIYAAK